MKRILVVFMACVFLLVGCGTTVEEVGTETENKSMFVLVEETYNWKICYHRDTKVMYAVSNGVYNVGTFTLLVKADGTPMLYKDGAE